MKVSTKGRYALRLMVDLGVNGGEDKYISLKDISASCRTGTQCAWCAGGISPQQKSR